MIGAWLWQSGDVSWHDELWSVAAVAVGGVSGASARWALTELIGPPESGTFPWATLVANLIGCLLIGAVATRIERPSLGWDLVATGLLGGFTTMSAFAVELNDLADAGSTTTLMAYLLATVAGGAGAVMIAESFPGAVDDAAEGPGDIE